MNSSLESTFTIAEDLRTEQDYCTDGYSDGKSRLVVLDNQDRAVYATSFRWVGDELDIPGSEQLQQAAGYREATEWLDENHPYWQPAEDVN